MLTEQESSCLCEIKSLVCAQQSFKAGDWVEIPQELISWMSSWMFSWVEGA